MHVHAPAPSPSGATLPAGTTSTSSARPHHPPHERRLAELASYALAFTAKRISASEIRSDVGQNSHAVNRLSRPSWRPTHGACQSRRANGGVHARIRGGD